MVRALSKPAAATRHRKMDSRGGGNDDPLVGCRHSVALSDCGESPQSAGMTVRWLGVVTPAKAGVHVLQTLPSDFDVALPCGRKCSSRFCALQSPDLRGLLFPQCCGKSKVLPEIGSATMQQTSEVLQVQGVRTTKTTKERCSLGAPFRVFRGLSRISWSKCLAWGRQCAWQTTCQRKTRYRTLWAARD